MSDEGPRVLFVSKPIAPPWNDGSKNLVRDVASHLVHARPTVMSVPGVAPLGPRVVAEALYPSVGGFSPGVLANARVMARLLRGDPHDVWTFVFAPNRASCSAALVAMRARRLGGWRGRVVQVVPSAPRTFDGIGHRLFGDHVVVVSEWTRGRLLGAGVRQRDIRMIPPCAAAPRAVGAAEVAAFRARHGLGDGPIVLYPGDYEVSRGARTVARAVPRLLRAVPEARVIFACRAKTPDAARAREVVVKALRNAALDEQTRHLDEVDDMPALLAATAAIAFPVDDLYGKVDLPLVLLEALAAGVPMVLARGGPLEAITTASFVESRDDGALVTELVRYLQDARARREAVDAGRALHAQRFAPPVVAAAYDQLFSDAVAAPSPRSARG